MSKRKPISKNIETQVLTASKRRCCLCVSLRNVMVDRKGQIAHLNHKRDDNRFENLVYLCLEHHDEYDSKTSQSKGLAQEEVRYYRDKLYAQVDKQSALNETQKEEINEEPTSDYENLRKKFPQELGFISKRWRYPLWQVANQPDFFAYKSSNKADGICLIERIDLPDGRIVIVCIQTAGNPGLSITNAVEELCFQICERFELPVDKLVWLQHYDFGIDQTWSLVTFEDGPPNSPFVNPKWTEMTPSLWKSLNLTPKKKLTKLNGRFESKIKKLF